jgi:hypothetical protein
MLFYVVGIFVAILSPLDSIKALAVLEPITLTALVASLLVPFAGFARTEKWQKFALQYAIVPLFGVYTVVLWHTLGMIGLLLLACPTLVHAGYWMSSIHSRAYRMELFRMLPDKPVATVQKVARLCAEGRSEEADKIIREILSQK